ncbi:MAG: hypothetical protein GXP62_02635 [Oligoflexia bacterium]|nr:hypothetical protein [Oligoflexia bacterium]
MLTRLVLRIERDGRLLGSWSLSDAPLQMKLVDVATGRVTACFTASADRPQAGGVDEVPVVLPRLGGDDFTMPLPEPSATGSAGPETEERSMPGRRRVHNLAQASDGGGAGDGLTAELVDLRDDEPGLTRELQPFDEDDIGAPTAKREFTPADAAGERAEEGNSYLPVDEIPLPLRPTAGGVTTVRGHGAGISSAGLTAELRTATLTGGTTGSSGDDTPPALVRPVSHADRTVPPAEVWAQKRGEWRNVGTLVPGQRVRILGGFVRLSSDGRLVVSAGTNLSGTATLVDGRMVEIAVGQEYIALPAGSSVMLASGERGLYVRSEPLNIEPAGCQGASVGRDDPAGKGHARRGSPG